MEIVRIDGMNRDLAPPGGWDAEKHGECSPLPVFAEVVNGDMVMTSAWKPDATELDHLLRGGAVACVVYGTLHPPIALGVFEAKNVPGATLPPGVGMGAQGLAGEIAAAVASDEQNGGCDLSAGMFGPAMSALIRRISAVYLAQPQPEGPSDGEATTD